MGPPASGAPSSPGPSAGGTEVVYEPLCLEAGSEAILRQGDAALAAAADAIRQAVAIPVRAKPVAPRVIGVGPECKRCKGTNTRVRDTKGPSRYPGFATKRVRYFGCADCGASWSGTS